MFVYRRVYPIQFSLPFIPFGKCLIYLPLAEADLQSSNPSFESGGAFHPHPYPAQRPGCTGQIPWWKQLDVGEKEKVRKRIQNDVKMR